MSKRYMIWALSFIPLRVLCYGMDATENKNYDTRVTDDTDFQQVEEFQLFLFSQVIDSAINIGCWDIWNGLISLSFLYLYCLLTRLSKSCLLLRASVISTCLYAPDWRNIEYVKSINHEWYDPMIWLYGILGRQHWWAY